jgi:hypothetical protein
MIRSQLPSDGLLRGYLAQVVCLPIFQSLFGAMLLPIVNRVQRSKIDYIGSWPIATFRCVVESGRYRMTADLTCSGACHGTVRTAAAGEQEFARSFAGGLWIIIDRLARRSLNSNLTGRPVFFCRSVARSAAYPPAATSRLFINPPARLASGDHVRLRHGVPGLAFWRQCRVLPPTRNLPALARRRSGSTGRGEASSRLTGTIGWILRQRPANFSGRQVVTGS